MVQTSTHLATRLRRAAACLLAAAIILGGVAGPGRGSRAAVQASGSTAPITPPASGQNSQAASGPQVTLSGWLSIVWGDGPPGAPEALGPIYTLTAGDGATTRLLAAGLNPTADQLLDLNGQRVVVAGAWVAGSAAASAAASAPGSAVLQVESIGPDPEAGAMVETAAIDGSQPWLSILCSFPDLPGAPYPRSYFREMYGSAYPGLDHYWRELAYDAIDLLGSDAVGWYALPQPRSSYVADWNGDGSLEADLSQLALDCTAAADADVYYPDYVGLNLMFNGDLDGPAWGGGRVLTLDGKTVFWRITWLPPWAYVRQSVLAHEMGHGFGLPHSSGNYGQVYDNVWDVMSQPGGTCAVIDPVYGCVGQHAIAHHKDRLGWIPQGQRFEAAAGTQTTITLEQLARPQTTNYLLAQIPVGARPDHVYTLEARRRVGYDVQLPGPGVIIHEAAHHLGIHVLDVDGNGDNGDAGAKWTVGERFTDPAHGITVTVDAETATGYVVTVQVAPEPAFTTCDAQLEIPAAECEALVALYHSTGGTNWDNNAGWLDLGWPCSWSGVICEAGHVTEISINDNQLAGPLPPELGNLTGLESLHLHENQLTGPVPPELGNLASLEILHLEYNALEGDIPPEIANLTNLHAGTWYTHLGYNKLTASDPAAIAFLDDKQPDWDQTQTVPPAGFRAVGWDGSSLHLRWTPIPYAAHGGYYEIGYALTPGGPYTVHGTTGDKSVSGYVAEGLAADTTYYFVVRTYTPAHGDQKNDLWSKPSPEISATTHDGEVFSAYLPVGLGHYRTYLRHPRD